MTLCEWRRKDSPKHREVLVTENVRYEMYCVLIIHDIRICKCFAKKLLSEAAFKNRWKAEQYALDLI